MLDMNQFVVVSEQKSFCFSLQLCSMCIWVWTYFGLWLFTMHCDSRPPLLLCRKVVCCAFSPLLMYVFQAGWKENHATFMCELKNLQASGLTTLGHALRTAFDLLNLNRLVSGIDNYGQVRDPKFLSCISLAAVSSVTVREQQNYSSIF